MPSPPPDKSDNQNAEQGVQTDITVEQDISEFSYELKIPRDRVAVLIGLKGKIKRDLEARTKTKIQIDSQEGDVILTGKDSLALFSLREVIRAVARGFNPDIAQLLFKQDYVLEIVPIMDFARNKNDLIRLRGRMIGADGKARSTIEKLTDSFIVVYGKTVAIIGTTESAILAKRATENLLEGSPHANIYSWLERNRKNLKRDNPQLL